MLNTLFSPLDVNYCSYFYFSSIFGFVIMCIMSLGLLLNFLNKKRKISSGAYLGLITQGFFIYFLNRLLYSMCVNSLM